MDLAAWLKQGREQVDAALELYLPLDSAGSSILKAMRYSIFAGGKRLRPILVLAGAEAVGGRGSDVMFCACAMEMIHTYSLVHDDLPAMDDDDYRRSVPTSHKVFGDGMAVLAGDGLLTQAMVMMCDPKVCGHLPPDRVMAASLVVFRAAGFKGMVGGQAADLEAEGREPELATVRYIHAMKTGALISASLEAGGILGGGNREQVALLRRYGRRVGLAFQIADDLLDLSGDPADLGKAVGMDEARGKMTYPAVVGPAQARQAGEELVADAARLVSSLGPPAEPLAQLAAYIMERTK